MNRRQFIHTTSALSLAWPGLKAWYAEENIFGHGAKKFRLAKKWPQEKKRLPVNDCHEMVWTRKNRLVMLTNETANNLIVFNRDGKIVNSWGHDFPGGHGLTLFGDDLWITDTQRHEFYQYSVDGKRIRQWQAPLESGVITEAAAFIPTETAVHHHGDVYVADGYGSQHIFQYGKDGHLKHVFGGRGDGPEHLDNAHGITIDYRGKEAQLIITDRNRCCFKIFSLDGQYLRTVHLPGANVCRPVIAGEYLYAAVLTSFSTGNANSGFVIILDKDFKVVSCIGGADPTLAAEDGYYQTIRLFKHPHDVCVDDEGCLYVCQWNSDKVYPYKFEPL